MSWRGNGKSGEVSSLSVARRSLVHGGVTATTVIFCFPSSENPCPSSKRMCPALFPFGAFSIGFMKRPDVCFSSSPKSPERGRESAFLRHRHPGPDRSRRSGAAPRPCPGGAGAGGKSVPTAEFTLQPGQRLPSPKMPAAPAGGPAEPTGPAGRRGRRAAPRQGESFGGSPHPPPGGSGSPGAFSCL